MFFFYYFNALKQNGFFLSKYLNCQKQQHVLSQALDGTLWVTRAQPEDQMFILVGQGDIKI